MAKKQSKQQIYKSSQGKCFICGNDGYSVLDAHRILPGEQGGSYNNSNMLVNCSNCHRRIHAGEIVIDPRKYTYTGPGYIIHFWIDGKEHWVPEHVGYYGMTANE